MVCRLCTYSAASSDSAYHVFFSVLHLFPSSTTLTSAPVPLFFPTPQLLKLTRRLARALSQIRDPYARDLDAAIFRLDRCLIEIRNTYSPTASLLWIDDVGASLQSVLRQTSASNSGESGSRSATRLSHSWSRSATRLSHSWSRSFPSSLLNNPLSERFKSSFARLVSPSPPQPQSPPTHSFLIAARTIDEWVAAVRASKDDRTVDDGGSCISVSDNLPPLPQHYTPCRDSLYDQVREALISACARGPSSSPTPSPAPSIASSPTPAPPRATAAIALVGPHGVGKTMLAMELVHDADICNSFADGVAWIQLGPDVTDEELADGLIRCVDTIIAGDFRSTVRYCTSLDAIVARASRLLRHVSSLVVIDDVYGPRARRAFKIVASALGESCVILYTAPPDNAENGGGTNDVACGVLESSALEDDDSSPSSDEEDTPQPYIGNPEKIQIPPLDSGTQEAVTVFRNWLTKSAADESRDGSLKHATDQSNIIRKCYGLPLALAMSAGYLSKFHASWGSLADVLGQSKNADETILSILSLLHTKGGVRFEQQLKAIGTLPQGIWVSLSALADLWGTDYRTIKLSARRMGRMAFGEYRLSDTSDDSRVRFHWHIMQYCRRITRRSDEKEANRRLLTNVCRRRGNEGKSLEKVEFVPWWGAVVTDKYLCRRLHWHMARGEALQSLNDLICDYQWVCHRLEKDSLLGVLTEFRLALTTENEGGRENEVDGVRNVMVAIQEVARLRRNEAIEMNALPTFLMMKLGGLESSSVYVRQFLTSMHDKARRPWLKPMKDIEPPTCASVIDSMSSNSMDSESMPYVTNCLTSSASGKVVCGDRVGNVHVYDPATGKNVVSWASASVGGAVRGRGVGALATINDLVISGHHNGRVLMRSIRSGRTQVVDDGEWHKDKITCFGTCKNGIAAIGTHTGRIFILKGVDKIGGEVVRSELEGHCDVIMSLHVFADGNRIASSCHDGFATIWKLKRNGDHDRLSLNGHRPDVGHKENYITTFASIGGGKRLLSACRGGVVSAWNCATGECVWTRRYGFEFSRSLTLQAFGVSQHTGSSSGKTVNTLKVGYPYVITRGEGPRDLLIVAAGEGREVLATIITVQVISTWHEVWHPGNGRIYVAVSHDDGRLSCFELITSLR